MDIKDYLIHLYQKYPDHYKVVENVLKEMDQLNDDDHKFIVNKIKKLQEYDNKLNDKIISNLHRLEINILTMFLASKKSIIYDKVKLDKLLGSK